MKVVKMAPCNGFAPDAESLAESLEALAQAVRAGREDIASAIVVSRDSAGDVQTYSFGRPTTVMEGVGMLEYAKMLAMQEE